MSKQIKVVKKVSDFNSVQSRSRLNLMRKFITIKKDSKAHVDIRDYVQSLKYEYGPDEKDMDRPEDVGINEKITVFMDGVIPQKTNLIESHKQNLTQIPEQLDTMVKTLMKSESIPINEIKRIDFTIIPPPKKPSSYENEIASAQMTVRNRFLYFINSDELINFKVIDAEKIQKMIGVSVPIGGDQSISEHSKRQTALHFIDLATYVNRIVFNNEETYKYNNLRNGVSYNGKLVTKRYIVVIDFIMTNDIFKKRTSEILSELTGLRDKDTEQGRRTNKLLNSIDPDILEQAGITVNNSDENKQAEEVEEVVQKETFKSEDVSL